MVRHRLAAWLTCLVAMTSLALCGAAGAAEAAAKYRPEQLVAKYGPAVVLIAGHDEAGELKSLGSGFLVTPDGEVVTNYHVARGAYPATVKLTNGDIYDDISAVDYDARRDLAILRVRGFDLPVVEPGNSDEVAQGARVVVIGNPMGIENSVSDGLWSGARDTGAGYKLQRMTAPIGSR
jgi:S1-C subfamily serine protease